MREGLGPGPSQARNLWHFYVPCPLKFVSNLVKSRWVFILTTFTFCMCPNAAELDLLQPEMMVAFSFSHCRGGLWCILNKGLSVSPWQLWQGHSGTSGGHVGSKVFDPWTLSGAQKPCANECAMSVWVGEVSYCRWGFVAELPLKSWGEAGLLFLVMNLEQIVFNTVGPDFWMWAEPM